MENTMEYPGVAVAVIVTRLRKGSVEEVLIGKRLGELGNGRYSLPGGKVDFGETPEAAAVRELKEETNLDIHELTFTGITTNDYFPEQGKHYVTLYYIATAFKTENLEVLEPNKVEAWEWHPHYNLPEGMWGLTGAVIAQVVTKFPMSWVLKG